MKQLFYSEVLNKYFEDEATCVAAEKEALEAKRKAEEAKEKKANERKARAEEVNAARKEAEEAIKKYNELLDKFIKDYSGYNVTIRETNIGDIFNHFWNLF